MSETIPKTFGDILTRYEWKKVEAPKAWKPKHNGEELAGFYGGKTVRNGRFGQYEVAMIHIPRRGSFMISGTRILQLLDTANINIGWPVRIVWKGLIDIGVTEDGVVKQMKDVDVFVAEGDPVAAEFLPQLKEQHG